MRGIFVFSYRPLIVRAILFTVLGISALVLGYHAGALSRPSRNVKIIAPPEPTGPYEFQPRPPIEHSGPGVFQFSQGFQRDDGRPMTVPGEDSDCWKSMRRQGVVTEKCTDIEEVVRSLRQGVYVYNKPLVAYVGSPFRIVLVLQTDPNQNAEDPFRGAEGKKYTLRGPFSQSVDAILRGADLVVDPAGPQRRTATLLNSVEWEWSVTASKPGKKFLSLEVVANLNLGSVADLPYQVRTLRTEVEIVVTPFARVREFLVEASGAITGLSAVIISIVGVVAGVSPIRRRVMRYVRMQRRRKKHTNEYASTDYQAHRDQ